MKKYLSTLTAAAIALTAFNAAADTSHCYNLAHGQDGLGSFKKALIPFVINKPGNWNSYINIVNTSEERVNVKVKIRDDKGVLLTPSNYSIQGNFMSNTIPFNHQTGGAILKPNYGAELALNETFNGNFTVELSWQADSCIDSALSTMMRVRYENGGEFDEVVNQFNGGAF